MVAPTRTPQARGVKCDLCKKILALATWLDQTKLAKTIEEAENVLEFIKQHDKSDCPCIPKGIENLLVGSTHFEIHRLVAKHLDASVYKAQYDCFVEKRQQSVQDMTKNQSKNINDCHDTQSISRFKVYASHYDPKNSDKSKQQLKHLFKAIDYWKTALEDQTHPFNSALALRLGLTHHVIYACYLFKYHKLLDYQLLTAILLLNIFKSIEGVTANAILHAYYLVVRSLMDCDQNYLAKHYLKQAVKMPNYHDKVHYESILLTCAACELNLVYSNNDKDNDDADTYTILDDLATLAVIQKDDKLQHYYARTYALSIVIKYIHQYPARSDLCFEFYHTYRFICAIIRRCYESSFELVLGEKDTKYHVNQNNGQTSQILDHSWIRFAVCDFVFATFDQLSKFYIRTGQPESLELLYNGLSLISYRNGSCYWQAKIASIGASLDILCDKYQHAESKIEAISRIINQSSNQYIMNIIRVDLEISLVALLDQRDGTVMKKSVVMNLFQQLKSCQISLIKLISEIMLYDCKASTYLKLHCCQEQFRDYNYLTSDDLLCYLGLKIFKIGTLSLIKVGEYTDASELMLIMANHLKQNDVRVVSYDINQTILETLMYFANCHNSEQTLLEAALASPMFAKNLNGLESLESKLSMLTISSTDTTISTRSTRSSRARTKSKKLVSNVSSSRFKSRRKGVYDVRRSTENSFNDCQSIKILDAIEAAKKFSSLSPEDIAQTYLRNSEPSPDYLLYRKAHELIFALRLKRVDSESFDTSHEQLLYHFSESNTANTMRFRWMMYEEQQASPFDSTATKSECESSLIKTLRYSNTMTDIERVVRSFVKSIPDDFKLVQFKYIVDIRARTEHILAVRFGNEYQEEPTYVLATRTLLSSDFLVDEKSIDKVTIPGQLANRIEKAKKTLFFSSQRAKIEARQGIESDIEMILCDIENEWLADMKSILCAESNQLGLILDNRLEHIPFESLPMAKINKQGIFRIPSLRIFNAIVNRLVKPTLIRHVDANETVYVLDPENNLANTRKRFESKLKSQSFWTGTISRAPQVDHLNEWLRTKQIFLFIGHGAGTAYYNQLCKGRGLSGMNLIKPMQIMMGCSSGKLQAEGPRLESFGISWIFIFKGSPTYVGLLWDVTDTDIDRFLDSLLNNWMGFKWEPRSYGSRQVSTNYKIAKPITEAVACARHVCQYKFLVGSSPVVYGLPMWIK